MLSMWYINISKGIPLYCVFKIKKSEYISPWGRQKNNGIWYKRLITFSCKCQTRNKLFEVFHIWPFGKCLNKIQLWYSTSKKVKVPYSTKFVELKWQHCRLNYILWLTILPYMNTFWWTVSGVVCTRSYSVTRCIK